MSALTVFIRLHAREGQAQAVAEALAEVVPATRAEPGCLEIAAYRSTQDPGLFTIHSRWADEAAFEAHAGLAHTTAFLATVRPLIDHPFEAVRTRPFA
ncbi:MAG: Antibiotic biosynthesis monooxygenase [Caulobacter sp.]|jgi:quinol monooxygenase YgiN|nr:Antibiotic biosynthesis monooxygenase [Caulobacter sp.]